MVARPGSSTAPGTRSNSWPPRKKGAGDRAGGHDQHEAAVAAELAPGDGGRVESSVIGIRLGPGKGVADGLWVLGGEDHPHDRAAVAVMLQDLLPDQLPLANDVVGHGAIHRRQAASPSSGQPVAQMRNYIRPARHIALVVKDRIAEQQHMPRMAALARRLAGGEHRQTSADRRAGDRAVMVSPRCRAACPWRPSPAARLPAWQSSAPRAGAPPPDHPPLRAKCSRPG